MSFKRSVLSEAPDGLGFYYGFVEGDPRQVNVKEGWPGVWLGYVGGVTVACKATKTEAERAALDWIRDNPHD